MKKKTAVLATGEDLLVDLTFHSVPASLLAEFAEKIVRPYYQGNINAAIQDLIHKTLAEQDFLLTHHSRQKRGDLAHGKDCSVVPYGLVNGDSRVA